MNGPASRCGTPACREARGYGLFHTMCRQHAERLARIRVQFLLELQGRDPHRHDDDWQEAA
jgi:hypothetical protein